MAEGAAKLGMSLDEIIDKSMNGRRTGRKSRTTDMQIERKGSGARKPAIRSSSRGGRERVGKKYQSQPRKQRRVRCKWDTHRLCIAICKCRRTLLSVLCAS